MTISRSVHVAANGIIPFFLWVSNVLSCSLCLTLCNPMDYSPPGSSVHGDSPGTNTGVGCHALLQGTLCVCVCVYVCVCMDHIFFIHSSVDGRLCCFHILATVNSAATHIRVPSSAIFWEEFQKDCCQLLSKCLTEFACEVIWS